MKNTCNLNRNIQILDWIVQIHITQQNSYTTIVDTIISHLKPVRLCL